MPTPDLTRDLLDPKNDSVFKRLFVRAPRLLVALINAVRAGEDSPISQVVIRNPAIDGEELGNKSISLDILAEDEQGRLHDIEMQVRQHPALSTLSHANSAWQFLISEMPQHPEATALIVLRLWPQR